MPAEVSRSGALQFELNGSGKRRAAHDQRAALRGLRRWPHDVSGRVIADSWFPFAGEITIKPLEPEVIPEPERDGVTSETCRSCQRPDESYVWTDEHWRLTGVQPTELPGMVVLQTRDHVDSFVDLPPQLLTALGPMISKVESALLGLGDIARVHVNRWGDGAAQLG
ncbi:MAG: hypothetical protein WKF73_06505 [Nocardioidaceae bacterium]